MRTDTSVDVLLTVFWCWKDNASDIATDYFSSFWDIRVLDGKESNNRKFHHKI